MTVVLLAAAAGASFGALTVAVRWGIRQGADPEVGALVAVMLGAALSGIAAAGSIAAGGIDGGALLPFLAAGLIAPGASQIALTLAVSHAGAARAGVLMGTAPLISIIIAFGVLGEPFRLRLLVGTAVIVLGGVALAAERARPRDFRLRGAAFALLCAALFATRDNLIRWAARDEHPPPLIAATVTLLAATALILAYLALMRRDRLRTQLRPAVPAFAPAGIALALGYDTLLAALDQGRVSVVSPLNATGSLWAVVLAAGTIGRDESIGRRTISAALLIVAGGALIGAVR